MLTDSQLFHLADAMDFKLEKICFKDELPKVLKYNTAYIINLDNSVDEEGNDNEGTHWTCLQVNKYPTGLIQAIFFDPYGQPPAEAVKKFVKDNTHKELPYTDKDIQSLMNNACGWYCCAFLHYINKFDHRTKNLYVDVEHFLDLFEDLDKSADFKKNEYILKHFFRSKDESKRREIEVFANSDTIDGEDDTGIRIPAELKYAK
jgi:uncharacterized protein YrzB (UPF0473 family)